MQTQQSQLTKKTFLHENDVEKGEKKNYWSQFSAVDEV